MKNKFVVLGRQSQLAEAAPGKPSKEERIATAKKQCLEEIETFKEAKEQFINSTKDLALFQIFAGSLESDLTGLERFVEEIVKGGDASPEVKQARRTLLAKIVKQYDI